MCFMGVAHDFKLLIELSGSYLNLITWESSAVVRTVSIFHMNMRSSTYRSITLQFFCLLIEAIYYEATFNRPSVNHKTFSAQSLYLAKTQGTIPLHCHLLVSQREPDYSFYKLSIVVYGRNSLELIVFEAHCEEICPARSHVDGS